MIDLILQTASKTLGVGLGIAAFFAIVVVSGRVVDLVVRRVRKSLKRRVLG